MAYLVPMGLHTLAEFVATILIMLIASGTIIGGLFLYFRLRARELELDAPEADARLRALEAHVGTVETRLSAMEDAIGALVHGLAPPPARQPLEASAGTPATSGAAENVLAPVPSTRGRS